LPDEDVSFQNSVLNIFGNYSFTTKEEKPLMNKIDRREPAVYQFKVTLKDIEPPIWRRFQVTNEITLHRLHLVLQEVMGWQNCHLYQFKIDGFFYTEPAHEHYLPAKNSRITKLSQVLPGGRKKFSYEYDFGDGWEHEVVLEKVLPPAEGVRYPVCLAGERACPPEDCGGIPGYERILEIMRHSDHVEYRKTVDWLGGEFDPEVFDLEGVNLALERFRKRASRRKRKVAGTSEGMSKPEMSIPPAKVNALHRFCKRSGVVFLGVFGSTARGADRPDSDVDVLVRLAHPKSLLELVAMEEELSKIFNKKVDLLTEAAISPYLRESIGRETVVLYEQARR